MSHSWPGNVRELQNALRSAIVAATGPDLTAADIKLEPTRHRNGAPRAGRSRSTAASPASSPPSPTAASRAGRAAPEAPDEMPSPRSAGDGGLDGDLADWFWDRWAQLEEPRSSPCEAIDAHLIRSALARAGGSLGEAGAMLDLSAEAFGRLLDRIGSSSAARTVRGHPIAEGLDRALGELPLAVADDKRPLRDRCRQLVLREMLVFCRGNKSEMARVLGWGRRTLVRELQRLEVI
jgi:DNA-binding NtrC family response regulator